MRIGTIFAAVTTVVGLASAAVLQSQGRTSEDGHDKVMERRSYGHYHSQSSDSSYWDSPVTHREHRPAPSPPQRCKVEFGRANKPIGQAIEYWDRDFIIQGYTFHCYADCTLKGDYNFPRNQGYWVTSMRV
ncbi:hypothetical protein PpBr36_07890 [Pyricularia pennisetigena]|uniref:hypothetical protein n=1 Tax=Pyricularia pennisetigena TaxID=1578925 RepID=UPI00115463E8|nr:hypothetical protein PpBr36_07890 [Pyricularia pennisetigena]TLS25282.1 hypothetical protein PpBr36_07890 [Pyricularia pennisetigena]